MRLVGCSDQELRIEDLVEASIEIFDGYGVHVMDQESVVDLVTGNTQVQAIVS
jgi:hypothetical protein